MECEEEVGVFQTKETFGLISTHEKRDRIFQEQNNSKLLHQELRNNLNWGHGSSVRMPAEQAQVQIPVLPKNKKGIREKCLCHAVIQPLLQCFLIGQLILSGIFAYIKKKSFFP
jgi:hypothetical protein